MLGNFVRWFVVGAAGAMFVKMTHETRMKNVRNDQARIQALIDEYHRSKGDSL